MFPPAKLIFAGVGLLLAVSMLLDSCGLPLTTWTSHQAARDVDASQDALVDLFERIENFFKRLEAYTDVPPTHQMTDLIVNIMVEVLGILAIATNEIRQRPASALIPCNIFSGFTLTHRSQKNT
jgi:deoxycytidylate deaminase